MQLRLELRLDTQHICGVDDCDEQASRFFLLNDGSCMGICSDCVAFLGYPAEEITQDEFEVLQVMKP